MDSRTWSEIDLFIMLEDSRSDPSRYQASIFKDLDSKFKDSDYALWTPGFGPRQGSIPQAGPYAEDDSYCFLCMSKDI